MWHYFLCIHMVDKHNVIDNYYIWTNYYAIKFLAISMSCTISRELQQCANAAIKQLPASDKFTLNWNDHLIYIKILNKNNIPPLYKCLHIDVATYGILKSREHKAYFLLDTFT